MQLVISEMSKHIAVLNDDYTAISATVKSMGETQGQIRIDLAVLTNQVEILMKVFWFVMAASIGAFITNIWQLVKMHKK